MRSRHVWWRAQAALLLMSTAQGALAATASFCPMKDDKVDPTLNANMEDIAGSALDAGQVTRPFEARAQNVRRLPGLSLRQTLIISNAGVCRTPAEDAASDGVKATDGKVHCTSDESQSLSNAALAFAGYFDQTDKFAAVGFDPHQPATFFTSKSAYLRCKADPTPAPAGQAGLTAGSGDSGGSGKGSGSDSSANSSKWSLGNIRVRGGSADLIYTRGSSGFSSADKAQLGFGNDHEADKRTTKFIGAVGYAYPLHDKITNDVHNTIDIVPYFAINLNTSTTADKPKSVTSNQLEFGSVFEWHRAVPYQNGSAYGSYVTYFAATPRYVINRADHSRVAGIDLLVRPSYGIINELHPIDNSKIWWNIIADVRLNSGVFVHQGDRSDDASHNFSRLGSRVGIGLATMSSGVPAELTVTDTYMKALTGEPGHLNLFKTDLSLYFNKAKYFGVDISYAHGRVEDLDTNNNMWTIGFAVKY